MMIEIKDKKAAKMVDVKEYILMIIEYYVDDG